MIHRGGHRKAGTTSKGLRVSWFRQAQCSVFNTNASFPLTRTVRVGVLQNAISWSGIFRRTFPLSVVIIQMFKVASL